MRFMDEFLRTLVFLLEVAGAVVIGIPLVFFGALCFSFLIYFVGFRALGQELRSLWKKRRMAKLVAAAPIRKVQPPRVPLTLPQCICGTVWEISGACQAATHLRASSRTAPN